MRAKVLLPVLWHLVFPLPDVAHAQSAGAQEARTGCIEFSYHARTAPDHYRLRASRVGRPEAKEERELIQPAGKGFGPDMLEICGLELGALYDISLSECDTAGECGPPVTYSATARKRRWLAP